MMGHHYMTPPIIPMLPMMVQSEGVASNSQSSPRNTASSPPPTSDDLKRMLRTQIEYYFSKENLSNDKYLCKCVCVWGVHNACVCARVCVCVVRVVAVFALHSQCHKWMVTILFQLALLPTSIR